MAELIVKKADIPAFGFEPREEIVGGQENSSQDKDASQDQNNHGCDGTSLKAL
jgi:hypothetical protein